MEMEGLAFDNIKNPVDDKPGRVWSQHRRLAPKRHHAAGSGHRDRRSFLARNHLHQLHAGDGIEEMSPAKAVLVFQPLRERGDGKHGGVGAEQSGLGDSLLQVLKDLLFNR